MLLFSFFLNIFLCQGYELSGEIALKNNHYYYYRPQRINSIPKWPPHCPPMSSTLSEERDKDTHRLCGGHQIHRTPMCTMTGVFRKTSTTLPQSRKCDRQTSAHYMCSSIITEGLSLATTRTSPQQQKSDLEGATCKTCREWPLDIEQSITTATTATNSRIDGFSSNPALCDPHT